MSRIALRFLLTGIGFLLFGMLWGIQMGMVGDHSQMPSHAHLNLVGGVLSASSTIASPRAPWAFTAGRITGCR